MGTADAELLGFQRLAAKPVSIGVSGCGGGRRQQAEDQTGPRRSNVIMSVVCGQQDADDAAV